MFAYIIDKIVPYTDSTIHISDLALQRGYGIFDFFRVRNKKPLFLEDHLDRFYASAGKMLLQSPVDRNELTDIIITLVEKNNLSDAGVKVLLTGGYAEDGYTITQPNLIVVVQPFKYPSEQQLQSGVKIITVNFRKELPDIKTINYQKAIMMTPAVKAANAVDLVYHHDGIISELPRCNFFIVTQEDVIKTPDQQILLGVTRKKVLQLARKKYKVEECSITLNDVYNAKEAFFTSSTKRIVPVVKVDDYMIGSGKPGKITLDLLSGLIQHEDEVLR
ncbi:aminotransferase class IV [Gynurincola endophyticus]|uniref:aminotransferase class IV n=1 Tax=Gynurincola endophyticus TaxID=2479004 RepID=UPI000F8EB013|nr:aminotransferase class IV [Gynurincola endophyticus]